MGMMEIRRKVMAYHPAQSAVGIFTKGYEATLTPQAGNSFTITHNLGIIPRLCIIELDDSTRQRTNAYVIYGIIDFNVAGLPSDRLGYGMFEYYYNSIAHTSTAYPNTETNKKLLVDEQTIEIGYPYGTSRSIWDTDADYHVRVWG